MSLKSVIILTAKRNLIVPTIRRCMKSNWPGTGRANAGTYCEMRDISRMGKATWQRHTDEDISGDIGDLDVCSNDDYVGDHG